MILDTDVLSAMSARHRPVQLAERLAHAHDAIYTTTVNWAEVCYGIARRGGQQSERLRARYEELVLPLLDLLDFDQASAEVYARVRAELERRGERLADADLMVVSIALRHDMILISGNTRHFARIPELRLENWLEG